jgi:hypothetical protein
VRPPNCPFLLGQVNHTELPGEEDALLLSAIKMKQKRERA